MKIDSGQSARHIAFIGGFATLFVGIWLRCHGIGARPLWLDEAYSAFAADHDFRFLWHVVPTYETHPPAYYSLLHLWCALIGKTVLARRSLGLLCGIATLGLAALQARQLGKLIQLPESARQILVAIAVCLASVQPLLITMSQQVRPYPVMVLLYAIALLALLHVLEQGVRRRSLLALIFAMQALLAWSHSLGPLYTFSIGLGLLIAVLGTGLSGRDWAWLVCGELLVALTWLPAGAIAWHQAQGWVSGTWLQFRAADLPGLFIDIYFDWHKTTPIVAVPLLVSGIILLWRADRGRRATGILLVLGLAPFVFSAILSALIAPVLIDRIISPAVLPVLLLLAVGLIWPGRFMWAASLPLVVLGGSMVRIDLANVMSRPWEPWYEVIDHIRGHIEPGDSVWAYPNEVALPLRYALTDRRRDLPVLQIPGPVPYFRPVGSHPAGSPGTPSLDDRHLAQLMRTPAATEPATLWLIRRAPGLYDPGDRMVHALQARRVIVEKLRLRGVDIIALRRKDLPPVAPPQQPQP